MQDYPSTAPCDGASSAPSGSPGPSERYPTFRYSRPQSSVSAKLGTPRLASRTARVVPDCPFWCRLKWSRGDSRLCCRRPRGHPSHATRSHAGGGWAPREELRSPLRLSIATTALAGFRPRPVVDSSGVALVAGPGVVVRIDPARGKMPKSVWRPSKFSTPDFVEFLYSCAGQLRSLQIRCRISDTFRAVCWTNLCLRASTSAHSASRGAPSSTLPRVKPSERR
jgi:hypothetical protein